MSESHALADFIIMLGDLRSYGREQVSFLWAINDTFFSGRTCSLRICSWSSMKYLWPDIPGVRSIEWKLLWTQHSKSKTPPMRRYKLFYASYIREPMASGNLIKEVYFPADVQKNLQLFLLSIIQLPESWSLSWGDNKMEIPNCD